MSIASPLSQLSVLRRKLDLMGYHEPLPLEAVPLVALLFRDFLQLTENFSNVKIEHNLLLKLKENFEDNVEPYKEENIKLTKENNELHQEILRIKENCESTLLDMKAKTKKMEDENINLKFLNNQYLQKTRSFKKVSQGMLEVVTEEQGAEIGGQNNQAFCHQQCMELRNILQPLTTKSFNQKTKDQDSEHHAADLLHLSAGTIVKLQNENRELLEGAEQAHKAAKLLEEKVGLRDKEIERLTAQLNLGKSLNAIALETKERKKDDVIQNLQQQLESLYHQNEELEKIIIKYCGKEYLPEKVRPSGMYSFMDSLCSTEKEAISRQHEKTSDLDKPTHPEDNLSCAKYIQRISRLEKALKLANLEKRKLAEKIPPLLAKEKHLLSEISRLKRKVPPHGVSPAQCSERLARLVQVLEAQRDFFKEEYETLKRLQEKNAKSPHKLEKKSSSDTKISEITTKDREISETVQKRSFVNLVEEERDFYKEKYNRLLERHGNLKEELSKPTADKEVMVTDDTSQELRKKNFELLQRIRELEHQIKQINSSKREFTESEKQKTERINLEKAVAQLQNTIEELQKKLEKTSKEKQVFMQKYQQTVTQDSKLQEGPSAEAEPALSELVVPNMYTDADVQEKIKEIEQQHKSKDAILHQQLEQLQNVVIDLRTQNEDLKDSLSSHKTRVLSLEHQVSSLQHQLSQAVDESGQHKTAAEQIRLMIGHGEQSTEQQRLRLMQQQNELDAAEKRIKELENNVEELKDILKHREAEIADLRSAAVSLKEAKEELTKVMSEKDLQISAIQQQMYSKEMHASELKITASVLEADVENVQSEIKLKDEEISSLKEQLGSKAKHGEETSRNLDILRRENSRLLEELSLLSKEHRCITETLEEKLQELDILTKKHTGFMAEHSRIQEVLSIKEVQRNEVIEQYKDLAHENARLETETRRLQSEVEAAQLGIQTQDTELQNLRRTVQSLEQEIEECMSAQEAHRLEITFMNSSVSELEAELHQKQQEIERLQMELQEARRFSVQLDASREHLQKLLADEASANAKLTSELDDLKDEIRALRAQLLSERTSLMTMESLMATHREKDFRSHLTNQELNAEVGLLRNRLKDSLEKTEILVKELSLLKTKIAGVEIEKERLKHEVTDERYERERDHNELLRLRHLQQQLHVSGPAVKSSPLYHSEFTSSRFRLLSPQETVPVPSTSETKSVSETQTTEVSSRTHSSFVTEKQSSHSSEFQAAAPEFSTGKDSRQMSKETSTQVLSTSSRTQSSHKVDSSEQHKKGSTDDDKVSSKSSSKDSSSSSSGN